MTYNIKIKYQNTDMNGKAEIELNNTKLLLEEVIVAIRNMINEPIPENMGGGTLNDATVYSIEIKKNKK